MKQILVILVALLLIGGGVFWWINNAKKSPAANSAKPSITTSKKSAAPAANEKSGTTTKTGKITGSAGKFYLQESNQIPKEIDSYVVDLNEYVDQTVTVSGQYSGDTLFVGSVE